jgi:cysteine synthase
MIPKPADSILAAIGNTPLVKLERLTTGLAGTIYAKLEFFSPGLSKKDRVALQIIEAAEKSGRLAKGQPVVELTSGNMGTGLAIVCRLKGYPFIAVMSRGNSIERAQMMKAFGAEVILVDQMPDSVPGQVSGTDLELVERETRRLTIAHGAFRADQFNNPSTMAAGETGIGPEIIAQLGNVRPDLFVDFMGTGGSFVGVTKALKRRYKDIVCLGIEPENAPYYSIHGNVDGKHQIQGGGYHQRLPFVERHRELIDGFVTVSDAEARQTARRLATEECIFAGFSSGANAAAALNLLNEEYKNKTIIILMPDSGTKYLSTSLWEIDK